MRVSCGMSLQSLHGGLAKRLGWFKMVPSSREIPSNRARLAHYLAGPSPCQRRNDANRCARLPAP